MQDGCSHTNLSHEIDLIINRLEEKFREIEPAIVAEVVHQCAAYFEGAPIRTFVPVLAEKRARERLRICGSDSERRQVLLTADERCEWVADFSETLSDVVDRPVVRPEVGVVELVPANGY